MSFTNISISSEEARRVVLGSQGLLSHEPFGRGKKATLRAIDHLGYVQIDAISVIERAHHHTLWTRVRNYNKKFLDQLIQRDKTVFEYWSHAVAFLPVQDYQFYKWRMNHIQTQKKHWYGVSAKSKEMVLERIENEGPLFARDFESNTRTKGEMWAYSPSKKALHELFMEGKLIPIRKNFQRQYDLPERAIPHISKTECPSKAEVARFFIKKFLMANGISTIQEMHYQQSDLKSIIKEELLIMLRNEELLPVKIKGLKNEYFVLPEYAKRSPKRVNKRIHFLSPFDNAVIQRKRLKSIFDFDYQTEIYYAKQKRKFGYFAMPILYGSKFIGRIDPKADRENGVLIIRNLQIDSNVENSSDLKNALEKSIVEFADFNGCNKVDFADSTISLNI